MADQEQQTEIAPAEVETFEFWDNDTKAVPEHYLEAFTVTSGPSDVTLLLGNTYKERDLRVDLCKLRLNMTHDNFMRFAEAIRKQAALLTKLYKGNEPGLNPTPEELDTAMKEVYGSD